MESGPKTEAPWCGTVSKLGGLTELKQEAFESRRTPHCHSPGVATVASHAACASMSTTTTTTTTTRDRGDRYGPMEWAQLTRQRETETFSE